MKDGFWKERGIAYRTNTFDNSRKTLVFIHGLGPTCSAWQPFEVALEHDFNVLTYDLRGHGFSRRYQSCADYRLTNLADDLRALLDFLDIRSCSLISGSLGTLVALLYMRSYPDTVQRNLLLAPIYKHFPLIGAEQSDKSLVTDLLSLIPLVRHHGSRVDYSRFEHAGDLQLGKMLSEIRAMSLRVYLFYLYHLNSFRNYAWWSQIQVPTTIIHGTKDSLAPYYLSIELSKVIPNAKLVPLEGANHMVIINNKKEIIAQIQAG
jgi:pimeloyl-ACP methyl ester carboxylesterase